MPIIAIDIDDQVGCRLVGFVRYATRELAYGARRAAALARIRRVPLVVLSSSRSVFGSGSGGPRQPLFTGASGAS
jgi:hypothetical protein